MLDVEIKPKSFRKKNFRDFRFVKTGIASDAIGEIEHGQDVYILTYGHFSLIDALIAILDKVGPADVVLSSWTAAAAHLEEMADMMEAASIKSLRMIVDRSFRTRQPGYHKRMRELYGKDCIRAIRCHAKFMLISNDDWKIVVRTSMNLNENPRFENIEVSEDPEFYKFMLKITDEIFKAVKPDTDNSDMPDMPEDTTFRMVRANQMEFENLKIPETSYVV